MSEYTGKFKVGDIVNAIHDPENPDFAFLEKGENRRGCNCF